MMAWRLYHSSVFLEFTRSWPAGVLFRLGGFGLFFESDLLGSPGIFPASSAFSFSFGVGALSENFSTGLWPAAVPDVFGVFDVPVGVVAPVDGAITVCIAVGVAVAVSVVRVEGTSITPLAV